MAEPKWRSYDRIGRHHPREAEFREGAQRNGGATDRCPLCNGRRLHHEVVFHYCDEHKSWLCGRSTLVACHVCKLRWGVLGTMCDAAKERASV